jgi:hypothetical protein
MAKTKKAAETVAGAPILKARLNVTAVSNSPGSQIVRLQPVDDLDGVNEAWSIGSPRGTFELEITNEEKHGLFESGKTYDVEFTPLEVVLTPVA